MSEAAAPILKAPFPYFGGKASIADLVWDRLGDPDNFVEPFAGGLAVTLRRPNVGKTETINDANHFVANFWRAVANDPDQVAHFASWPVSEADLHARHRWLMRSETSLEFRQRFAQDPDAFDAKIAGWWVCGQCCWIGSAWCTDFKVTGENGRPTLNKPGHRGEGLQQQGDHADELKRWGVYGRGVNASATDGKRPALCNTTDIGVNSGRSGSKQLPYMERGDRGIARFSEGDGPERLGRPQLADAFDIGRGVNSNRGAGTCEERDAFIRDWMRRLADRLRLVRVCYGDWNRICNSPTTMTRLGTTGAFLDPPYALDLARLEAWKRHLIDGAPAPEGKADASNRASGLYANDASQDVCRLVADVNLWCRKWGADPAVRIVLAGYEGEHDDLLELGWNVVEWKANGGYGNRSGGDNANAKRERLWTSPACIAKPKAPSLFDAEEVV